MLLQADWLSPRVFAGSPAFQTSERGLVAMPQQQRDQLVTLAMADSRSLRAISEYAVTVAEKKAARGDTQSARDCLNALFECGRAWQNPKNIEIIRLTKRPDC